MADFGFITSLIFLLYSSLLLQHLQITEGKLDNHLRSRTDRDRSSSSSHIDHMDPELNVFFHYKNLKLGNKMKIYFPKKDLSKSPHFLSKHESDSIPFSSSHLSYILQLFSFPEGSKQALAMKDTLHHCEFPPIRGESKFCATSLESMLDSIIGIFGLSSKFKVLTTTYLTEIITPLQNYTVFEDPIKISTPMIIGCHTLPYPYAVFYCHGQVSDNKLYKVLLAGEDGGRVEAIAICHMDTSQWDSDHVAFRVLKTVPGASPVCHFFPSDNLVWVPVS
ncbi:hypothetical protein BUALT_Bualt19G0116700 [Buddleja alternifolia]|uniref:BURP domain-containing protein n=1 Tax=Buddleja alternifolia TaxID=168488 RepID=A0AAV6WAH2_9LAMI|nr:hypothetical protein BUALT_Bualt19G0116700 [Buddleja alternifolia]